VAAGRADEDAAAAHALDDLGGRRRVGVGGAGADDLDADRETDGPDLADERRPEGDLAQPYGQGRPDLAGMLDEPLVLDDLEHREGRGHRHRVAAERAEEVGPGAEALGDVAPRDDRRDRVTVAHRLAERHDVGPDAEAPIRPRRGAAPAVAALDLVGDPQRAGRPDPFDERRREPRIEVDDPVAREDAAEDRGRRTVTGGRQVPDGGVEIVSDPSNPRRASGGRHVRTWSGRGRSPTPPA
jgi:hypothetical protein